MSENPLLEIRYDIPFSRIQPQHVEPAIKTLLAEAEAELEALLRVQGPRTLENTLRPLDRLGERLFFAFNLVAHLESVASTPELRAAYKAVIPSVTAFSTRVQLSSELYKALKELAESPAAQQLSPDWARFLKLRLDKFRRRGPTCRRRRPGSRPSTPASPSSPQFEQNLTDSTAAWELYLEEEQVAGLPPSALEAAGAPPGAVAASGYPLPPCSSPASWPCRPTETIRASWRV